MPADPHAAKIIDEIISMWWFVDRRLLDMSFGCVEHGLDYVAQARRENPEHPITVALADELRKRGMIE